MQLSLVELRFEIYFHRSNKTCRISLSLARYPERTGAMSDIAFVPTMGALHAGHQSLIHRARELSDRVVVSIFVNPLQFENSDDLAKYPRHPERDAEIAIAAGATEIWTPTVKEIYPSEDVERISAGELGSRYEGSSRAGHFDGMLTVVDRLFAYVKPRYAIFGEKDFQQLTLIKSWVKRCEIPVEIIASPTVRDSAGLALSSRNERLSPAERAAALVIPSALKVAIEERSVEAGRAHLKSEPNFTVDYFDFVDESTMAPKSDMRSAGRFIVAGWVNQVRLLDNMAMVATA